jgi:tyrosyl-tRNA synthetase
VVTSKLLADPTGKKMGKSEGNMIAFSDTPIDAYGKLMSWPDEMILPAFEVLTDMTKKEIEDRRVSIDAGENPMKFKRELAQRVVAWMFGEPAGQEAADHFTHVHQQHEKPEDIAEMTVEMRELPLIEALVAGGLVGSKSDARRQIEQGGVKVNDQVITDVKAFVTITEQGIVIQKGKRHFVKFLYKG